jgi:hypothetical protein
MSIQSMRAMLTALLFLLLWGCAYCPSKDHLLSDPNTISDPKYRAHWCPAPKKSPMSGASIGGEQI